MDDIDLLPITTAGWFTAFTPHLSCIERELANHLRIVSRYLEKVILLSQKKFYKTNMVSTEQVANCVGARLA